MRCLIVDDEPMACGSLRRLCSLVEEIHSVETCGSSLEAFKLLKDSSFDLVFLDIEMPEMNGLELLESLDSYPHVIITSANKDYAFQAFEYEVSDFLAKPITIARFMKAMSRIITKHQEVLEIPDHLFVRSEGRRIKVRLDDVLFVESIKDYVIIRTKKTKVVVHITLKKLLKHLSVDPRFMQIHRSFICNLNEIVDVEEGTVLVNDHVVPVSRTYKKTLLEKLNTL